MYTKRRKFHGFLIQYKKAELRKETVLWFFTGKTAESALRSLPPLSFITYQVRDPRARNWATVGEWVFKPPSTVMI